MKNPKIIYHISWIFALVSLVCIGFSTWNITNQVVESQSLAGSIKADNVINSSEYIDFDTSADADETKDGMECFDYCADGFIVENTLSKTATLTAYFKINLEKSKITFAENSSLQAVITLRGTNGSTAMTFFDSKTITGTTVKASVHTDNAFVVTTSSNGQSQVFTYTINFANILDSGLDEYAFAVEYTISAEYYNLFYPQINSNPQFHLGAKITGVN